MTNKEWIDLLSKEFNVSRTVAKTMLHVCMQIKKFKKSMYPGGQIICQNRNPLN